MTVIIILSNFVVFLSQFIIYASYFCLIALIFFARGLYTLYLQRTTQKAAKANPPSDGEQEQASVYSVKL